MPVPCKTELIDMYNNTELDGEMALMMCVNYRTANAAGFNAAIAATAGEAGNETKRLTKKYAMRLMQYYRNHNAGAYATTLAAVRTSILALINASST